MAQSFKQWPIDCCQFLVGGNSPWTRSLGRQRKQRSRGIIKTIQDLLNPRGLWISMSGVANNVKEMCPRSSSWARSRHWQLVPVCSILLTLKILLNTFLQAASTKRLELGHESKAVCSPFQRKVPFCSRRNKPREKRAVRRDWDGIARGRVLGACACQAETDGELTLRIALGGEMWMMTGAHVALNPALSLQAEQWQGCVRKVSQPRPPLTHSTSLCKFQSTKEQKVKSKMISYLLNNSFSTTPIQLQINPYFAKRMESRPARNERLPFIFS